MSLSRSPIKETERPILTIQQHILEQQQRFPGATGEFSWLLSGITLATKMIAAKVRIAGLNDILGVHGDSNVHGESQQKLDVYANKVLLHCLGVRDSVAVLASEENHEPVTLARHDDERAKYVVVFDPLDGSSNIDVNVNVGTIFSILKVPAGTPPGEAAVLQAGTKQLAAGYVLYGAATSFVYTCGAGVHGFTLDPEIGAFVLSHPDLRMPEQGKYYSVNEAYRDTFPASYREYVDHLRHGKLNGVPYSSRYIGSMVSDFHRTLLRGGVFLYPPTDEHGTGKLRLLYEANPIAMIAEAAGGAASNGRGRVLEAQPDSVHQRTPLIVGSQAEMAAFDKMVASQAM